MFIIHLYLSTVGAALICSLVSFRLHYSFHLKLLSALLAITLVIEIIANFFLKPFHLRSNFPVYNIYMLIEYPLLALYFKRILISKTFKTATSIFLILYPVFWCCTFLFIYNLNEWNSYGIMVGDLFIITFAARYLYELFTADHLIHFSLHPEFWIAVAIIFYSCCELPITGILNFWVRDWKIALRLLTILQILNIIMYSIFIYAFLCPLKATKKR